jgi:hypothetical protein
LGISKADVYRLKGDLLLALGLRRVSAQIRAEALQPWILQMNEIQRVSADFRRVFPGG